MRIPTSMACGLMLAMAAGPVLADGYIDADRAAEHPDFEPQGEYLGEVQTDEGARTIGIQIAARGDGVFELLAYQGGLPGAGWDGEEPTDAGGERRDGEAVFTRDGYTARVSGGELRLSHEGAGYLGTIGKVTRESPTLGEQPPDGAVLLFDGTEGSLANWRDGASIDEHARLVEGATSEREFGDIRLHVEFQCGFLPGAAEQSRANSGVYIQNRYEVQILDSFAEPPTVGGNGSIYRVREADVNMSFPPLVWQTYDIDFTAPRFDGQGNKTAHARLTVKHNGVLIHDDVEMSGGTGAGGRRPEVERGPLHLQDHGDPVRFRNVWLIEKN